MWCVCHVRQYFYFTTAVSKKKRLMVYVRLLRTLATFDKVAHTVDKNDDGDRLHTYSLVKCSAKHTQ